jgi:thioredoxin 1
MLLEQDRFEADVLGSTEPVLVDLYGDWCAPCKALAPVVEGLARDYRVCKVNIDERGDLASRFHVNAVPTLVVVQGGREVERLVGVQSERRLRAALDRAGKA